MRDSYTDDFSYLISKHFPVCSAYQGWEFSLYISLESIQGQTSEVHNKDGFVALIWKVYGTLQTTF